MPTGVRALSSALKTLDALTALAGAERPLRLVEVASKLGSSRATAYQRLLTLIEAGWLEQTVEGAYRLSPRAMHMSEAALRQAGLGERANQVLQELVQDVRETACIAVIHDVHAEIVQRVEPDVPGRATRTVGTRLSLNNSAAGRILTAFAPEARRAALAKVGGALASESVLRDVSRLGYAVSTGRDLPGARSVAVPVFGPGGGCASALVIVAPVSRFSMPRYVKPLARAAERLRAA